jgi:hypothetical protein
VRLQDLHAYVRTSDRWQEFTFDGSKKVKVLTGELKSTRRNWRNNARQNFPDLEGENFGKEFPQETRNLSASERLGFPAAYSPDKHSFAAAVLAIDPAASVSNNLKASLVPKKLLLRSNGQERRLDSLAGFSIYTLAWEPDSERIAIVESNYDRTPRSLGAFVEPSWDGGVVYSDIVLSVYQVSGTLFCQSLLASKVPNVTIAIDWGEE